MWEPDFSADPNALSRIASFQNGTSLPCFGSNCALARCSETGSSGVAELPILGGGGGDGGLFGSGGAPPLCSHGSTYGGVSGSASDSAAKTTMVEVVTMQVPRGSVGRVIGAGGANVRALEESSGAKVTHVCKPSNAVSCHDFEAALSSKAICSLLA